MTFLLAHLSDPHIGPLPRIPLRNLLNKRLTGALNWHGARASIHNMVVLDALIADIRKQAVDHVALTGDLVNVGYAPEFPLAKRHLAPLGGPERVSMIPGNHDAYVPGSLRAMAEEFGAHMLGDDGAGQAGMLPSFPYLRVRKGIALIGVNSGIPTLPFMATGHVGATQRAALARMLRRCRQEGLLRVVMIHHPPLPGTAAFGRGLHDAPRMAHLLREEGAELVLHGHNHRFSQHTIKGPDGAIPVIGVGSASAVPGTPHHRAEYHLVTLDTDSPGLIRIQRRGLSEGRDHLTAIGEDLVINRAIC